MMPLALIGVLIVAGLVGWGVWTITKMLHSRKRLIAIAM
jgi:hypothetical protein